MSLSRVNNKHVKAEVHLISGCKDDQKSKDILITTEHGLPDSLGQSSGACTTALLKVLYREKRRHREEELSFQEVLLRMRKELKKNRYDQIPQLTSSRPLDIKSPFNFVPENAEMGTKRAVLIGINYVGFGPGELKGCHNDVLSIKKYIMEFHAFEEKNITILMDDGEHLEPTRANILDAYDTLVSQSEPGDAAFCHFSGHGAFVEDKNYDEDDGYDETLVPVDFLKSGQITDDVLHNRLVSALPEGVALTCFFDCCHSGSILDLPYKFVADGKNTQMVFSASLYESVDDGVIPKILRYFQTLRCCENK